MALAEKLAHRADMHMAKALEIPAGKYRGAGHTLGHTFAAVALDIAALAVVSSSLVKIVATRGLVRSENAVWNGAVRGGLVLRWILHGNPKH